MGKAGLLFGRRSVGRVVLAAALLLAGLAPQVARAQAPVSEAQAKAKFTLTLARFVQWPASAFPAAAAPLRLCVLHNSPAVAAAFASHQGAMVGGRPVRVLPNPPDRAHACDLLFVDGSAARSMVGALGEPGDPPLLTLGAVDGFLSQGGMVELVNVDDSLRFDVNLKALRAAQLGLSGQVLKLARQVRE